MKRFKLFTLTVVSSVMAVFAVSYGLPTISQIPPVGSEPPEITAEVPTADAPADVPAVPEADSEVDETGQTEVDPAETETSENMRSPNTRIKPIYSWLR